MKGKYLAELYGNLAFLLDAGINITSAVTTLQNSVKNKKLKNLLLILSKDLSDGISLDEIFKKNEKLFGKGMHLYINAGLRNGNLPEVLQNLKRQISAKSNVKKELISDMIYPVLLICSTTIISYYVFTIALPKMITELSSITTGEIPALTAKVMNVSDFLVTYNIVILTMFAVLLLSFALYTKLFKLTFAKHILRIPFLGGILRDIDIINIYANLSCLLNASINELDAINACYDGISNRKIKNDFRQHIILQVQKGESFGNTLTNFEHISEFDAVCLYSAEFSGKTAEIMDSLAKHLDEDCMIRIKRFTSILQPIALSIIAVIIGIIALSISTLLMSTASF